MKYPQKIYIINKEDNVAVALEDITAGDFMFDIDFPASDYIPAGHKIALTDINIGDNIIKYGYPIGHAKQSIRKGQHVHTHNVSTNLAGIIDYEYKLEKKHVENKTADLYFNGYLRENGDAGVRNEIWIIPTVGCVNKVAERIATKANMEFAGETDGIYAFPHTYGCSEIGYDHEITQKVLAGLINNPNAGGVLVLGLGCEINLIETLKPYIGDYIPDRIKFLTSQDVEDEIDESIKLIDELVKYAKSFKRERISAKKLVIGLNCGGSDGFSGITANPLLGEFSDRIINNNGTVIMTEVPEMFGAETILMNRCKDEKLFRETVALINNYKEYFIRYGQPIYENPSPGNKEGGISTLDEKSLGCIHKGGNSEVTAVLNYGEKAITTGLNLLNGPGNDIIANTSLAAAGAQIILFTTGRGTPIGAPVPTIKISSNTTLYNKKKNWIDFDAGKLLNGTSFDDLTDEFTEYIISAASGKSKPKNETNDYREIAIFKDGVIQ